MTLFSYSGRVKSPEWRLQRRRADLQQFYIFRHRPIIIYTSLPAELTYYPICMMFPTNGECLIGISDAFFGLLFTGIRHLAHVLSLPTTKACLLCVTPAGRGLLGDSGGVVKSLDFCPASLKSLGCFYFRCVLSSQWKAVTVNLRILHCQL